MSFAVSAGAVKALWPAVSVGAGKALRPALLALGLFGAVTPASAGTIAVDAHAVPLAPDEPGRNRVGDLLYLGGLRLDSADSHFGGWSGMEIDSSGTRLTAIADTGWYMTATIRRIDGRIDGLDQVDLGPLTGEDGKPMPGDKLSADAEALTRLPDGGYAVSFEQRHRILHYPAGADASPFAATPTTIAIPAGLTKAEPNGGLEALLALEDGRMVGFAESLKDGAGNQTGWLFPGAGQGPTRELKLVATDLYKPTDLKRLPDGDFVLLQRRFTITGGPGARLSIIPAAVLTAKGPVHDRELGQLVPPMTVDNFECLALWRDGDGHMRALILSDDNTSFLQRTLLLEFQLP